MVRARTWAGLSMLVALVGCGGGGSSGPTNPGGPTGGSTPPPSTDLPMTRTVIDYREFGLKGGTAVFYNQDKLPPGTLDVNLNWSNGDHAMALYLTTNTCPGATTLRTGGCTILAQPEDNDSRNKPLQLTYQLTAPSTNVTVWAVNTSRQGDDGRIEVGLTTNQPYTPPTPVANPGDYKDSLPDGPVSSVFVKVRSIDTGNNHYRDPYQDRDGNWIVYQGEFVVFDSTQKNSSGQECKWVHDPKWTVDDPGFVFIIKGSSQPFLMRVDVNKAEGFVQLSANIDGVDSNVLPVKIVPR